MSQKSPPQPSPQSDNPPFNEEVESSGHFRIVYLADRERLDTLCQQFERVGADVLERPDLPCQRVYSIGRRLVGRLSRFGVDQAALFGAQVYFFDDLNTALRVLPGIDPELVLLDERANTHNFESFREATKSQFPRGFHFPMRRLMVIIEEGDETERRSFQLGAVGIRGVLVGPRSAVKIFAFASHELHKMWKGPRATSVCISGGGVEGYVYAIGVARALEVALENRKMSDFDIYCGVSSGSILASCLAMDVDVSELVSQVYRRPGRLEALTPRVIFDFATGEVAKRFWSFLRALPKNDIAEIVSLLQRLVPIGFFRGERMKTFFENQLKRLQIKDSFLALKKQLFISGTDQDTGEHVVFGEEPWRDIRISQAIRASCALPPFFLPERIKGHWFADGQLTSSSDFMTAIAKGAGLVILIDPMVAYTSNSPGAVQNRGGYFSAIQAIKSLVQTRASSMWTHAMDLHPDVDFLLFQPSNEVMEAMAGSPMRYRIRTELTELGFHGALKQILANYDAIEHKLEKHGFRLRSAKELQEVLGEKLDTASTFLRQTRF